MGINEIIPHINWVDVIILILLFRISYAGFSRGLASESIPLIGVFTALNIALHLYLNVGNFIARYTPLTSTYSYLISFIALSFITKYIFQLIEAFVVGKVVTIHIASIYDNIGGLIVGVIRAILLVSIVMIALSMLPIKYMDYSVKEKSFMGKKFIRVGHTVHAKTSQLLRLK